MHLSKEEQRKRSLERLDDPSKHWKFSPNDLAERKRWDDYQQAFEDAINATAHRTRRGMWCRADNKWVMRLIVSTVITEAIQSLDLRMPEITDEKKKELDDARTVLESEG